MITGVNNFIRNGSIFDTLRELNAVKFIGLGGGQIHVLEHQVHEFVAYFDINFKCRV